MSKIHNSFSKDNLARKEGFTPKSGKRSRRGKDTRKGKGRTQSLRERLLAEGKVRSADWQENFAASHGYQF